MRNVARLMATTVALATGLTAWSCRGDSLPCGELTGTDVEEWHPRLRGEVEAALGPRRQAFEADSANDEARRAYAEVLFKLGDIWEADEVIAPWARRPHATPATWGSRPERHIYWATTSGP